MRMKMFYGNTQHKEQQLHMTFPENYALRRLVMRNIKAGVGRVLVVLVVVMGGWADLTVYFLSAAVVTVF